MKIRNHNRKRGTVTQKNCIPEANGVRKSAQSANLGLPMWGASAPTSLQKFHASNATLTFGLFIPGSPMADIYSNDAWGEQWVKIRKNGWDRRKRRKKKNEGENREPISQNDEKMWIENVSSGISFHGGIKKGRKENREVKMGDCFEAKIEGHVWYCHWWSCRSWLISTKHLGILFRWWRSTLCFFFLFFFFNLFSNGFALPFASVCAFFLWKLVSFKF